MRCVLHSAEDPASRAVLPGGNLEWLLPLSIYERIIHQFLEKTVAIARPVPGLADLRRDHHGPFRGHCPCQ